MKLTCVRKSTESCFVLYFLMTALQMASASECPLTHSYPNHRSTEHSRPHSPPPSCIQQRQEMCICWVIQLRADIWDHWGPEAVLPPQQGSLPRLISWSAKNKYSTVLPRSVPTCSSSSKLLCTSVQTPGSRLHCNYDALRKSREKPRFSQLCSPFMGVYQHNNTDPQPCPHRGPISARPQQLHCLQGRAGQQPGADTMVRGCG